MPQRNLNIFILTIIPLSFLFMCLVLIYIQPPTYAVIADPNYMFLLNGLNFAQAKFISGNFVHPGIPLQILCSFIIKGTHFLTGGNYDMVTDVFSRPEFYITIINVSLTFLISVVFFVCGFLILKITDQVIISLFLQSFFFVNHTTLFQLAIIGPERLVFPLLFLLICLLSWYLYNESTNKYIWILAGIIIGICTMQKLTMLPLIIVPLFLIKKRNELLKYAGSLSITIILLLIPIMSQFKNMFVFFTMLTKHSGIYGTGKQQFIDLETVMPNISTLFNDMRLPVIVLILLILFIPFTYFLKKKLTPAGLRIRRLMYALVVAELLISAMILKHFKSQYFAPIAAFSFFHLFLCIEFIRQHFNINKKTLSFLIYVSLLIIPVLNSPNIKALYHNYPHKAETEKALNQVNLHFRDRPAIILPRYYGTPFIEYSILLGYYWVYNKDEFGSKLKEMYPYSYFYSSTWGTYDMAYTGYKTKDVLLKYDKFILFYYYEDTEDVKSFFRELNDMKKKYTFQRVFYYQPLGYAIDEIQFLPDSAEQKPVFSLSMDMETDDPRTAKLKSLNIAKSGKYSLKLDDQQEYGVNVQLPEIKAGDRITASVWRYDNSNKSSLVLNTENSKDLYFSKSLISETHNLWNLIDLDVVVPDTFAQQAVRVYLWHNDKSSDVYYDDFKVNVFR